MEVVLDGVRKLQHRLTARVPGAQVELQVRARLLELARTVTIKGFRPGKVPASVVEQRFGTQVRNEAVAAVIASALQELLRQSELRPALAPSISARPVDGGDIEFTADFEVMPEPGPIDVSGLVLTKCVARVEDIDVERAIESLRQLRGLSPADDITSLEPLGIGEDGMERVRQACRENLERELAAAVAARTKADALRQLLATYADLDVPRGLVDIETQARLADARRHAIASGLPPPEDAEAFAVDAQSRVRAYILLTEIARQNGIAPEQSRINATLQQIAAGYDEPEKVVELYVQDTELMASLRNRVIEDQVIEWLINHAQVVERKVSFNEVMTPDD